MNIDQQQAAFEAWLQTHCDYDDLNKSEIELSRDAWQAALASPEVEALRKDAERYRWLREQPNDTEAPRIDVVYWVPSYDINEGEGIRFEALDATIDSEMEKGNERPRIIGVGG